MKKILLFVTFISLNAITILAQNINEFHYDNVGADANEFVEIFVPNNGCTYTVVLYNGDNNSPYSSTSMDFVCTSPIMDACGQAGKNGCFFVYEPSSIQNGAPDGFALIQDCTGTPVVIQFISYEGTITATAGPANGLTSTDVGVAESGSTPLGSSLEFQADNTGGGVWKVAVDDTNTKGECNTSQGPLPVQLTSFAVNVTGKVVEISWTTASEFNNSHFNIEHSIDGANFRAIDEIAGYGTTQEKQSYSYTHTIPAIGTNYYRLKQVDYDGAFEYSDIRVVEIKRAGKIVINPSAAIAEITIRLAENTGDNNQIGIYDMMGRTVMMSAFDGTLDAKTIDISNLEKGYYVVRVQAGSEVFTERFMKMVD